jgi:hypothetical protein
MKPRLYHLLFAFVLVGVAWFVVPLAMPASVADEERQTFELKRPLFIDTAYAEAGPAAVDTFDLGALLDQEAGISAYYKAPDDINLNQVRDQFRTIEMETADFIIGSVAIPNHPEHFDVHVYVNKNGWILAYYLKLDPVAKIVEIYTQNVNTTKLKTAVSIIAGAAGAPFTDVTYYDFRYPNATNILFVAEEHSNGNNFTIKMPSTYGYLERSWALRDYYSGCSCGTFQLNGTTLNPAYNVDHIHYGVISASQLLPDVTHTITVVHYGVLVILYRVP